MPESFHQSLLYKLNKSEFTSPLETDDSPYGSLFEPNDINLNFTLSYMVEDWVIHPFQQLVRRYFLPVEDKYLLCMSRQQFYRSDEAREIMDEKLGDLVGRTGELPLLVEYARDQALKLLESNNINATTAESDAVLNLHFDVLLVLQRRISLEDQSVKMVPAADSSIEGLKRAEAADYNMSCSICLEDFSGEEGGSGDDGCCDEEEGLLIMPCSHVFHGDCIKKWLSISHYCPLCRLEMPTSN